MSFTLYITLTIKTVKPVASQPASQPAAKSPEEKSSFFASIFHQRYEGVVKNTRSKIEKIKLFFDQIYFTDS
jgi:hypothetical protein